MRSLAVALCCASLALFVAGSAQAERIITITGKVIVEEDAAGGGGEVVRIVTETDTYLVHAASKPNLADQKGQTIAATGKLLVTETRKSIAVAEFAILEGKSPAVGAK